MIILPIGVQSFERIRKKGMLYEDKTARLLELICQGAGRCFLSRPRRFGKSLTVATLEAMFQGRAELFHGMAAQSWVAGQTAHPSPVLRLDMSRFRGSRGQRSSMLCWQKQSEAGPVCGDWEAQLRDKRYAQAYRARESASWSWSSLPTTKRAASCSDGVAQARHGRGMPWTS